MNSEEVRTLVGKVRESFPTQEITESDIPTWQMILSEFRYAECLLAVALLRCWYDRISPERVRDRVRIKRTVAGRPAYQAGGAAWQQSMAASGGREYEGGPVCWDPRVACEGVCRNCPVEQEAS